MAESVNPVVRVPDPYAVRQPATRATAPAGAAASPTSGPDVRARLQGATQAQGQSPMLSSTLVTPDGRFLRAPGDAPVGGQAPAVAPASSGAPTGQGAADSLASLRAAEDIIQAASAGPPTAEGRRIAAEAFLMEAQAQHDFEAQQARAMSGPRHWMA